MRFPWIMNGNENVTAVKEIRHRGGAITSPRWRISVTAVTRNCHRGDGWRLCVAGKTHYKNIPVSRSFLSHANLAKNAKFSCIIDFGLTQISQCLRLARPRNLTKASRFALAVGVAHRVYAPDGSCELSAMQLL